MSPRVHPASARAVALRVLLKCRQNDAFVQDILDNDLRQASLPPADRRLCTHLAYGVLRRRGTLDALLRPCVKRPPHQVEPWLWEALRLGAYQLFLLSHVPPHAALNETVELAGQDRSARGFVNGVLRALLPLLTADEMPSFGPNALPLTDGRYRKLAQPVLPDPTVSPVEYLAHGFSLPASMAARWLERFGWEECVRLGFWFAGPAPLVLRVNGLRLSREDYLLHVGQQANVGRILSPADSGTGRIENPTHKVGGEIAMPGHHPQAVRWQAHQPVTDIPGYADGWFVVQDESAMRVADALALQPGERVLDLCAAPGGKTTHVAELMRNQGQIVACDVSSERLTPLEETCRRLGLTNIEFWPLDAKGKPPDGPFDAVLVDVPCSNTGVLGKRPEARWRLKPGDFGHLRALQKGLLEQGCERVRPGGRIVYSTCSIEREENEQVVRAVLKTNGDFTLEAEEISTPGNPADGGYWARLRRVI